MQHRYWILQNGKLKINLLNLIVWLTVYSFQCIEKNTLLAIRLNLTNLFSICHFAISSICVAFNICQVLVQKKFMFGLVLASSHLTFSSTLFHLLGYVM